MAEDEDDDEAPQGRIPIENETKAFREAERAKRLERERLEREKKERDGG